MQEEINHFYLNKPEPLKGCLLALRDIILAHHPELTAGWKYQLPFFSLNGKNICYLWFKKKTKQPYIGFVDGNQLDHPSLIAEDRSRIKILLFNADEDLPIEVIHEILDKAVAFHVVKS